MPKSKKRRCKIVAALEEAQVLLHNNPSLEFLSLTRNPARESVEEFHFAADKARHGRPCVAVHLTPNTASYVLLPTTSPRLTHA
jgi:hypothetical protein